MKPIASILFSFQDPELKRRFSEACTRRKSNMSNMIRLLITRYLESEEQRLGRDSTLDTQLDNTVRQRPVSKLVSKLSNPVCYEHLTLDGWTIRQDKHHGYYRAYRKINGKLKSVYLGKSLDGAQVKIAKAVESGTMRKTHSD